MHWYRLLVLIFENSNEAPGELGWFLTLIIVSLISALIGAIVMITVIHCRSRLKNSISADSESPSIQQNSRVRPAIDPPSLDKDAPSPYNSHSLNNGVWSWLTSRKGTSRESQLTTPTLPVENHYTHMEDPYAGIGGEALYAELDRESNSPAYQNSAYTDPDAPVSSAPSSAYYSDLSITTMPERAYEVVGLSTIPNNWESPNQGDAILRRPPPVRLAAISETISVPSDYV